MNCEACMTLLLKPCIYVPFNPIPVAAATLA